MGHRTSNHQEDIPAQVGPVGHDDVIQNWGTTVELVAAVDKVVRDIRVAVDIRTVKVVRADSVAQSNELEAVTRPVSEKHQLAPQLQGWCHAHLKFGARAYSCEQPCTCPQKNNRAEYLVHSRNDRGPISVIVCFLPEHPWTSAGGTVGTQLQAANGTAIATFSRKDAFSTVNGYQYPLNFYQATINRPLLGANFLVHHCLFVNVHQQQGQLFSDCTPGTCASSSHKHCTSLTKSCQVYGLA